MDLADIIDRFRGPVIGLIASWGASPSDAVEIAQDSIADAYLSREACRGDSTDSEVFGRWLRGVARNNFRNAMRSQRRREKRVIMATDLLLESASRDSEQREDERLVQLRAAIDALPAKLKQAIMMHYIETTTVKDVAALLSVSPKTIEGRLYQARRELKRMLGVTPHASIVKALFL